MNRKWIWIVAGAATAAGLLQGCGALMVTGAAATAVMVSDRRTTGTYVEDESIEWKVIDRLRDKFPGAHVNSTSYNRRVLLTGEVPTEEAKKQVEERVRGIENVKDVVNELQVAGASSLAARGSDSLTTSNVKARMVNNGVFSPTHVKVLTEAGTVYLMGLVTPAEGEAAVNIARNTSGASRVVKVFEYVEK
jgi:osmotically-inducible protein OsmY